MERDSADGDLSGSWLPGWEAFDQGGVLDQAAPSGTLALFLESAAGPDRSYADLTDDQLTGALSRWAAHEAWTAAGKLAAVRALIRRHPAASAGIRPGGLPTCWNRFLADEIAVQLRISVSAADAMIALAWALEARLPQTAAALDAGIIDITKARIIAEATSVLDDAQAAKAEAMIAGRLGEMTPGQLGKAIARAVVTVDPDGARKRREEAQREKARVTFWREHAGTAALAAFGLPPDEALAADQHIQNRALAYKKAGIPGTLDLLRIRAFIDLLTERDARDHLPAEGDTGSEDGGDSDGGENPADGDGGRDEGPGGSDGTPAGGSGNSGGGQARPPAGDAPLAAIINLTLPLATYLGLADRPGELPGFGAIDPALARDLATRAAASERTRWHVTLTDPDGAAIGHGCAKPMKGKHPSQARDGPGFTRAEGRSPPGGYGTWTLTTGGAHGPLTVSIHRIPVTDCDHQLENKGHDPSDLLRHLVQIRDGTCTYPPCAHPATRSDYEHAVPYEQGGRTCACNGGMRHRRHHLLKQAPGWTLTQDQPGYHTWAAPSGRTYTQGPHQYPI